MSKIKTSKGIFYRIKRIFFILLLCNISYIILTRWIHPPITTVMISSWYNGDGLKRDYIHYNKMGKNIKLAVVCAEDQLFPMHNGFDIDAIKKALQYNQESKNKKIRGASTLSQQVAKNVFLWHGRNWFRKGLEVYHTFMIEKIWGKKRILETYLNVAEMGKGIFGIQAASQHYFHKNPNELSRSEAAWIASILPNPKLFSIAKPIPMLVRKHNWILRQMKNLEEDDATRKLIDG